jgi:FkbM family methyltransferase
MNKIYSILLDHIIHNLKFLIGKKKFFFFSFISSILIFNKKFGFKIFKIRNFYDYITVREIFLLECYNIENLVTYDQIKNYYSKIVNNKKIPLIIDCGSNIGASPYYFKEEYSKSKIICLEPDVDNFKLLQGNVADETIIKINKAISSNGQKFDMVKDTEDPRAFGTILKDNGSVESLSINELLSLYKSKIYDPFLIKIDIEGGEQNLFSENIDWIDKFKLIIIEPHDWMYPKKGLFNNFLKRISSLKRDFVILNENIISIRND